MKKTGKARWEITRDEVYQMVASMPFIARQLWVRQVRVKGKLVGYKLKHIAKDSLPHQAGFRNGDIVTRINGKTLADPLKLLLWLLDGNQIVVHLKRDGKLRRHVYVLVP
jgi:type II secretory pathway component PulC